MSPLRPDLANCPSLPRCYLEMLLRLQSSPCGAFPAPRAHSFTLHLGHGQRGPGRVTWTLELCCREHEQGLRDQGQRWGVKLLAGARCCKWAADGISWVCCAGAALGVALLAFLASKVSSPAAGAVGLQLPALISPSSLRLMELGSPAWLPQAWGSALGELHWCMSPLPPEHHWWAYSSSSSPGPILPALAPSCQPWPCPASPGHLIPPLCPRMSHPCPKQPLLGDVPPVPAPGTPALLGHSSALPMWV